MIQRGSDTSFTNLWSLLLYIQSLLHYIENAQENKKNTMLSYNIAENGKRIKRNEEKVCVCVCLDAGWCLVSTLNKGNSKIIRNRLDLYMNRKTESKIKLLLCWYM
jgi:hypothetical protein